MDSPATDPAPALKSAPWASFLRFLAAGGVSYVVDVGTLVALHSGLSWSVGAATSGAYLVAFFFTFTINRLWVFRATGSGATGQVGRYLVLVAVNYVLTLGIVLGLTGIGLDVVIAKTVATAVIAVSNFAVYRFWVFRSPGDPLPPL